MKKIMRKTLLSTLAVATAATAITATVLNLDIKAKQASASTTTEVTVAADGFEMLDGASIRMAHPLGLRFIAEMGADVYSDLTTEEAGVEKRMGMFIMPYSYLSDSTKYANGAADVEAGNYQNITTKIEHVFYDSADSSVEEKIYQYEDVYRANGVISNLKLQNYDKDFIGIAYIAETSGNNTTYTFAKFDETDNVRCATYVAIEAYEDYDADNARGIFNEYVKGAHLYTQGELTETATGEGLDRTATYTYNGTSYDTITEAATAANVKLSVTLDPAYIHRVGSKKMLPATIVDNGTAVTFNGAHAVFKAASGSIIDVAENGIATAKAKGITTATAKFMGTSATGDVIAEAITFDDGKMPSFISSGGRSVLAVSGSELNVKAAPTSSGTENNNNNARVAMKRAYVGAFFADPEVDYLAFDVKMPDDYTTTDADRVYYQNYGLSGSEGSQKWTAFETNDAAYYFTAPIGYYKTYYVPRAAYDAWATYHISNCAFLNVGYGILEASEGYYVDNIRAVTEEERVLDWFNFEYGGIRTNNGNTPLFYTYTSGGQWEIGIENIDVTTITYGSGNVTSGSTALTFTKKSGRSQILLNSNTTSSLETMVREKGYVAYDLYVPEGSDAKLMNSDDTVYQPLAQGWNTIYAKVGSMGENVVSFFRDSTASTYTLDNIRFITEDEYYENVYGMEMGGGVARMHKNTDKGSVYWYANGADVKAVVYSFVATSNVSEIHFDSEIKHSGDYSLAFTKVGDVNLQMRADSEAYARFKNGFSFWLYSTVAINGTGTTNFNNGNGTKPNGGAGYFVNANEWTKITLTADDIVQGTGTSGCAFLKIIGSTNGTYYIDDMQPLDTRTVTLDAGTGSVVSSTQVMIDGMNYTLPTPTSYTDFLGWYDAQGNLVPTTGVWSGNEDVTLTAKYSDRVSFENGVVPTYMTSADDTGSISVVDMDTTDGGKALQIAANGAAPAMKVTIEFLAHYFASNDVDYIAFEAKADKINNNFRRDTNRDGALTAVTYEQDITYTHPVDGVKYPVTGIRSDGWKTFYFSRADYDFWVAQSVTSARFIASGGFSSGDNIYLDNIRPATEEERTAGMGSFESGGIRVDGTAGMTLLFYTVAHGGTWQFNMQLEQGKGFTNVGLTNDNVTEGNSALTFTKAAGNLTFNMTDGRDFADTIVKTTGYWAVDVYVPEGAGATIVASSIGLANSAIPCVVPAEGAWTTIYVADSKNQLILTDTNGGTYCVDNMRSVTAEEYLAAQNGFEAGTVGLRTNLMNDENTNQGSAYVYNKGFDYSNVAASVTIAEGNGSGDGNALSNVRFDTNAHSGSYSVAFDKGPGYMYLTRHNQSKAYTDFYGGCSFWLYSTVEIDGVNSNAIVAGKNGKLNNGTGMIIPANTWTQITVEKDEISSGRFLILQGSFTGTIYIDDFVALPYEAPEVYNTTIDVEEEGVRVGVVLAPSTASGSTSKPTPNTADMSYIAFKGAYGLNDYLVFDMTGDNMPIISFFNNKVTNTVFNNSAANDTAVALDATARGWVLFSGLYNNDGTVYGGESTTNAHWARLALIGSHKVIGFDNNTNDFRANLGSADNANTTDVNEWNPHPLSIVSLRDVQDTYRVIVGIGEHSTDATKVYVEIGVINMVTCKEVYKYQWEISSTDFEEGSIAIHGQFGKETVLDKVFDIEENTTLDALMTKYNVKDVDYSDEDAVTLDRYAYSSLSDGQWTLDGENKVTNPTDFRLDPDAYKTYSDAGFNIVLAQDMISTDSGIDNGDGTYTPWAESANKTYMDNAYNAGLKVILTDWHLQVFSAPLKVSGTSVVSSSGSDKYLPWILGSDANATTGEAAKYLGYLKSLGIAYDTTTFADRDALDARVAQELAPYMNHPAFYGVMLADEPSYHNAYCYGKIYQSIKRVMPSCYVQYNLLPMEHVFGTIQYRYPGVNDIGSGITNAQIETAYKSYVESFLDTMGTDYVQYDDYPFKSAKASGLSGLFGKTEPYIDPTSLRNIQIIAEIAKERDLDVKVVSQSCVNKSGGEDGAVHIRQVTEADARWLNNYLMGFGVKQINYFTYWTKRASTSNGEYFVDGGSFVNRDGTPTALYTFMQTIMDDNDKFAPTIMNFDYKASQVFGSNNDSDLNNDHISWSSSLTAAADFRFLSSVETSLEYTLVTELYDDYNYNYMYMIMNTIDPNDGGTQSITVTLDSSVTQFYVYDQSGNRMSLQTGNTYTGSLTAGQAVYIMPCAW